MIPDDWRELIRRVDHGEQVPVETLESAIAAADIRRDRRAGFDLRIALINSCQETGRPDLILAHYPWCLSVADDLPEDNRDDLLFRYRWAVSQSIDYPEVPRRRLEELIEDMAERYQRAGYSQRGVWILRVLMATYWWDEPLAERTIREHRRHALDRMSDTLDTERCFVSRAQLRFWPAGHASKICRLELFDPYHARQVKSALLLPLLELGERQLAAEQHAESLRLAGDGPHAFAPRSCNAAYLALTGRIEEAAELIEADLPLALRSIELSETLDYFSHAALVLGHAPADRVPAVHVSDELRRQRGIPAGPLTAAALAEWCRGEASEICRRYDQHCGNPRTSERLRQLLAMQPEP